MIRLTCNFNSGSEAVSVEVSVTLSVSSSNFVRNAGALSVYESELELIGTGTEVTVDGCVFRDNFG